MKKVEAIIDPFDLDAVKVGLSLHGVQGVTVTEMRGGGGRQDLGHFYRGVRHVALLPKVKVEVVVRDDQVAETLASIEHGASSLAGEQTLSVTSLDEVLRIRTGVRESGLR
jgi:nitrogen regulatory protein P-II 1